MNEMESGTLVSAFGGTIVPLALSMLVAHIVVTSLVTAGHLQEQGSSLLGALVRGTLVTVVGGPVRFHRARMAAVRADAARRAVRDQGDLAAAKRRHPSMQHRRHLSAVPSRVA